MDEKLEEVGEREVERDAIFRSVAFEGVEIRLPPLAYPNAVILADSARKRDLHLARLDLQIQESFGLVNIATFRRELDAFSPCEEERQEEDLWNAKKENPTYWQFTKLLLQPNSVRTFPKFSSRRLKGVSWRFV